LTWSARRAHNYYIVIDAIFQARTPTEATDANPKRPYVFTEARRQSALHNLGKARAALARKLGETEAERSRARAERRFQKRQQHRRQHGFFFFHRWGLYAMSFARSLKHLGESKAAFRQLWVWSCLVFGVRVDSGLGTRGSGLGKEDSQATVFSSQSSVLSSEACGGLGNRPSRIPERRIRSNPEHRSPNPEGVNRQSTIENRQSSSPESRVPSPQPRINRHRLLKLARALAQSLWLGRRVRRALDQETAIRLEARLRTMAELQAILRGDHGAEAQARLRENLGRVMGPELEEYKCLTMFGADPGLVWPRRLSRHLMEMILEVVDDGPDRHEQVAKLRRRMRRLLKAGSGERGSSNCRFSMADRRLKDKSSVVSCPSSVVSSQSSVQDQGSDSGSAHSEPGGASRPDNDGQRTTDQGRVDNRQSSIDHRKSAIPGQSTIENRLLVNPQTEEEIAEAWRQHWQSRERLSPAAQDNRLRREMHLADQHGLTTEELLDHLVLKPAEALSRLVWKPGQGWWGESWHRRWGTERHPVSESYAAGPRAWWPEARELEMRAEVEKRRLRTHTPLAYGELKELVGAAFGLTDCRLKSESGNCRLSIDDCRLRGRSSVVSSQSSVQEGGSRSSRSEPGDSLRSENDGEPATDNAQPGNRPSAIENRQFANPELYTPNADPQQSAIDHRRAAIERVARLLWLIVNTGEGDVRGEERRLERSGFGISGFGAGGSGHGTESAVGSPQPAVACDLEAGPGGHEPRSRNDDHNNDGPRTTDDGPSAPTPNSELRNSERTDRQSAIGNSTARHLACPELVEGSLVTRHLLLLHPLEAHDRENEFRRTERQLRLSEALRRLGQALHPEPIQARTERGYLYRLMDEFDCLRLDPLWLDPERKAALRQDLGIDPLPEDFETPELPDELLDPRSPLRRALLRETMRKVENASWRRSEEAQWEERQIGILFTPEYAKKIESGRLTVEEWKAWYVANS